MKLPNPTRLLILSRLAVFMGLLLLPFLALAQPDKAQLDSSARQLISNLVEKKFAAATDMFDDTMRELMPDSKLAEVWRMLQFRYGAFKSTGASRYEQLENYDIIYVATQFDKTTLDAKIVFDAAGKITGLFFVPAITPPPSINTAMPADSSSASEQESGKYREEDFILESGDYKLPGVLTLPLTTSDAPVALLIAGSGPNDRDSTIGPNKPLRDIARGLAANGIASLRYDKRTKVYGMSLDVKTLTYKEEVVDDALAAIRALRREPRVNGKRIFLIGHSLGAHLAPTIAAQAKNSYLGQEKLSIGSGSVSGSIPLPGSLPFATSNLLSGMVLLAGNTRKIVPMIMDQFTHIALEDGRVTPQERSSIMNFKASAEALLESDEDRPPVMGLTKNYLKSLNDYDPIATMKDVDLPVMILQGGRDYQVSPRQDYETWHTHFDERDNVTFKLYPSLNHLFIAGEGTSYPAEYSTPGRVSDEVIADISDWIKSLQD